MDRATYLDFDLIVERSEAGYRARVLSSPAGRAAAEFILPFSELELENFLLRVGRTRRGVRRLESPEMKAARVFGVRLFEAVFGDEVRGRLRSSLNEATQRGVGLRIRLRLGDVPELADLPWEYLYDPTLDRFLSLSAETPVIRYLDLPQPIRPLTVEPPLRVLAMIASPNDYPLLDVDREWAKLRDALSDLVQRRVVSLERLGKATLATLQRQLRRKEYHIFHFIGHGGFDQQAQDGILLLEAEGGQGRPVSGRYLGTLLHDHRSLRLAMLNACEGARSSRSDPFAGTAQSLVQQGIPAVIAMQFEITDEAAITLAHEFYAALADGYSVDAALAEARKAIFAQGNDVEWGTPVLYTCLTDGRIFDVTPARAVQPPIPTQPPAFDEELEQRLEQLYTDGLSAFWLEEWEKACRSFQAIVDARPDYQDAVARLEEAGRQWRLSALYDQAQAAVEAGAWQGALSALEELAAEAADFKDVAALLETTKKQKQLADLYAQAHYLYQARRWQAVVNVFAQIATIEPDYPDPENLLPAAKEELAELKRQAERDDLYSRAVREMDAGHWQSARQSLAQVQEMEPGFRETDRLLARAEAEIEREQTERQRQEQVATLYEQAQGLTRAHQWRQALAKMGEIQTLDPQFADPEGIAARAQAETAKEEEEARRQGELAALYAEAVRLLQAGQYQEALEKWREVQDRDPRYPDRKKVQATARKKLAALAKSSQPKRGLPRWAVFAIGGIAVVAFALVGVLLSLGPGGTPEATPTRIRIPTTTSRSPTPTPALSPPSPVSALLSNAKVLYYDDLDQLSSTQWHYTDGYVRASGGLVEITGTSDWAALLTSGWSLNGGECVVVLFKYNADAEWVIKLDHGEWGTSSYKRWGIYFWGNEVETSVRKGKTLDRSNELEGDLTIEPDKWYYLLLAVTRDAEFVAQIWERDDPTHTSECRRAFDGDWAGLTWSFGIDANSGKVYVDDFAVVSFSEILGSPF